MGHGWGLPVRYGGLSLVLYPVAMARWGWVTRDTQRGADAALAAAVAVPATLMVLSSDLLPPPPASAAGEALVLTAICAGGPALWWCAGRALRRSGREAALGDGVLLAIGVALDVTAWADFVASPSNRVYWGVNLPWLLLWLGWQAVAAAALSRHLSPGADAVGPEAVGAADR